MTLMLLRRLFELGIRNGRRIQLDSDYLTSVMRGESQSSVLCLIGDGMQETIEKRPDEKERLKAAELLGKRYGLYTDKVDIDADMELNISIDYGDDTG